MIVGGLNNLKQVCEKFAKKKGVCLLTFSK